MSENTKSPSKEPAKNTDNENAGADGDRSKPKGDNNGPKWSGGGEKGEDEQSADN